MYLCITCGFRDGRRGEISDSSQNPILYAFKSHSSPAWLDAISFWSEANHQQRIARVLESSPWQTSLLGLGKVLWEQAFLTSSWAPTWATSWAVDKTSLFREILASPLPGSLTAPVSLNPWGITAHLPSLPWVPTFISPERSIQHLSATTIRPEGIIRHGPRYGRPERLLQQGWPPWEQLSAQGTVQRTPVAQQCSGKCQEPTRGEVQVGGFGSSHR